ncbi:pentapeptide repeat-containing protein [Synechocystis salina LEGE 06099]|uniref:pentapeptide repeat-containing protein n=1 Tax=Synechocystis salina TaxID=945780 RepID=UPI001882B613|nr:pentapeptide repeat-containing protein [Synechocystis salina]MBE9202160.1 pentapeptide repeat-containing protein [Synechocystis salina LEGE 06099]
MPNELFDLPPALGPGESSPPRRSLPQWVFQESVDPAMPWLLVVTVLGIALGLVCRWPWLGLTSAVLALMFSLQVILPTIKSWIQHYLTVQERRSLLGGLGFVLASGALAHYLGLYSSVKYWLNQFKYDEFGSWAEWVGALGQIMIAVLAVYVAWQQYVISKDLTIQQNRITQQQTIDAYFQGISDLALSDQGMLEDWPQERAFAEGRTAAILASVDSGGKAKILRFLSQSRLLTPLKRDYYLGRPIFDGMGGYQEDRIHGLRVINLGVMLVAADLVGQDLRWVDLSEIYLIRANLSQVDLVKANLSRAVLYEANLDGADLKGTRLFYGTGDKASPRSRNHIPNYETGEYTGAVVENANFSNTKNMSEEQRCYCCAWGGTLTRKTIPGGCEGIENLLGR